MFGKKTIIPLLLFILLPLLIGLAQCTGAGNKKIDEGKNNPVVREKKDGDYTVKIDLTNQLLLLDIPEEKEYNHQEGKTEVETRLYPTLKELIEYNDFVSASIISAKAKQFDDGLYGAVEIACEEGTDNFEGKKLLLSNIQKALKELDKVTDGELAKYDRNFILAASELGGQTFENEDKATVEAVEKLKTEFLSDPLRAKPIGFYTWSDPLRQIFQQDRLLQSKLDYPAPLARAIINSKEQNSYAKYLELTEKLTNPLTKDLKDLRPLIEELSSSKKPSLQDSFAFFPPSRAYETELVKKLYGNAPVPDNFNLADKLIEEIKAGRVDIKPKDNSGWYDYQTYSLEPLILPDKSPEAKKLEFSETYKKELLELFKSLLALTRETHIKQLEIPLSGAAPPHEFETPKPTINIYPDLSLEPLATYYLRRARAYNFVNKVLVDAFGKEGLKKMHRLTAEGPVKVDLEQELSDMEALFYGASLLVSSEIGCNLEDTTQDGSGRGEKADMNFAEEWLKNIGNDPDIIKDSRMMVPVFYDVGRKKTKVWVFLGYEQKKLSVEYKTKPEVTVFDKNGKELTASDVDIVFHNEDKELIYPVFAEIYVNKILNRDEFRALCDKYTTRSQVLEALQK